MEMKDLLFVIAGAVTVLSVFNWRLAIKTALVMLIVEGALRKWAFPQASELLYFAKDLIILGGYIGYLKDRQYNVIPTVSVPLLYKLLAISAYLGALQVCNFNLPSLILGIIGFKSYYFYTPLLFIVPSMFNSQQELNLFLRRYLLILIPVALLGIIQFYSPSGNLINKYVKTQETIATFGIKESVRVTSTFPYISGYVSYLIFSVLIVLGIIGGTRWSYKNNIKMYIVLVFALLAIPMTGSRWPVYMLVLLTPIYIVIQIYDGTIKLFVLMRFVAVAAVIGFIAVTYTPDVIEAFSYRAKTESDAKSRVVTIFEQPYEALTYAGIFGYGIGATHNSASVLIKDRAPYEWLDGHLFEEEPGRVMLELGMFGFILVFIIRVYLVLLSLRLVKKSKSMFNRSLATVFFLFFIAHLNAQVIMNSTAGILFWFTAGMLMSLFRFESELEVSHAQK